jgi:hypothetical protein
MQRLEMRKQFGGLARVCLYSLTYTPVLFNFWTMDLCFTFLVECALVFFLVCCCYSCIFNS